MNDVLSRAQSLIEFSGELERSLSTDGAGGVPGVIDRFLGLQRDLAAIDGERLAEANREVHGLIHALAGVGEQIEALLSLKHALPGHTTEELP